MIPLGYQTSSGGARITPPPSAVARTLPLLVVRYQPVLDVVSVVQVCGDVLDLATPSRMGGNLRSDTILV